MSRTAMIMAGGTGGHIFPGLAVADYLRGCGWDVVWMGAKSGMEARLVPPRGYRMAWVRARALRGKGLLTTLLMPLNLLIAFWESARALFRERPDVVIGFGGYVAFPGGMMAALFARPLAIHEQNAIAGLANRVLAGVADCVMSAFPGTLRRAHCTGNPVRGEIAALEEPPARFAGRNGPLRLLVVGGSLGASVFNDVVPGALARIPESARPSVVHQSGEAHLAALREVYARAGVAGELVPFIDDMPARYAASDLVICRAGAMTIAELAAAGVASVLVPYPHAVDDHQRANARYLSDRDAAILVDQKDFSADALARLLMSLDRDRLLAMAVNARALGKRDAVRDVAEHCMRLAP